MSEFKPINPENVQKECFVKLKKDYPSMFEGRSEDDLRMFELMYNTGFSDGFACGVESTNAIYKS